MLVTIVYDNNKDKEFLEAIAFKTPIFIEYINALKYKKEAFRIKSHWGAIKLPFVEIKDDESKPIKVLYSDVKGDNAIIQLINLINNAEN